MMSKSLFDARWVWAVMGQGLVVWWVWCSLVLQGQCSLPGWRRLCVHICDCCMQGTQHGHISAGGIRSVMIGYASQYVIIHLYILVRCYTLQHYGVEPGSWNLHVVFGLFRHSVSVFIIFLFFSLKHAVSTADLNAFFPTLHVSTGALHSSC